MQHALHCGALLMSDGWSRGMQRLLLNHPIPNILRSYQRIDNFLLLKLIQIPAIKEITVLMVYLESIHLRAVLLYEYLFVNKGRILRNTPTGVLRFTARQVRPTESYFDELPICDKACWSTQLDAAFSA